MAIELDDAATSAADPTALRGVYGQFPTGVMAMCAMHDGDPVGFAVSSFNTISIEPPLVAVCVQQGSSTWPLLAASPRIGLSVLAANQKELCRNLARRGRFDRLSGAGWSATPQGAVLIADAAGWLECNIHDIATYGDHELVVLRVRRHRRNDEVAPLVFHASGFRGLVA
ncbi:flavin reductase family protein [Nonomuraea monospora]|uniref:Flavin reductase family protein n=1 Tax=Nonomuraea monospora TaxID=568818 RepID=A0ABN3D3V0_9ACTN